MRVRFLYKFRIKIGMEGRYRNIFVSFRGPSERDDAADPGKQLENNTTKAQLHLIDFGDEELVEAILSAITKDLAIGADLLDVATSEKVSTSTQVQIRDIDTTGRTVLLVGVSGTGHDPLVDEEYHPTHESPEESEKRVDGVIYVGDEYVIVQESKFQGQELTVTEMGDYKSLLQVEEEHYGTVSWENIHSNIDEMLEFQNTGGEDPPDRSNFLASQFKQYLEMYGLKLSESESQYSNGEKFISLRFQPEMNVVTSESVSASPEYAVHFHSLPENDGISDFYISQSELEALLEDLGSRHPKIRKALQSGVFEPINEFANEHNITEGDTKTIAEIGDQETGRKRLQVAQPNGADYRVLGFRRASPGSSRYSSGAYYMLADGEFLAHFSSVDDGEATTIGDALFGADPDIMCLQ